MLCHSKTFVFRVFVLVFFLQAVCITCFCQQVKLSGKLYDAAIDPAVFSLNISNKTGETVRASDAKQKEKVTDLIVTDSTANWYYPGQDIHVKLIMKEVYLDVAIVSGKAGSYTWPNITQDLIAYTIPWHGGKYVPAKDSKWIAFFNTLGTQNSLEQLSMPFIGINYSAFSLVYIFDNIFNNEFSLKGEQSLELSFTHEFSSITQKKEYGFRIYMTPNDPVAIAKTYKKYLEENNKFVTLEQKAAGNPNIRKLYGAPFIYVWGGEPIVRENVKDWNSFAPLFKTEVNSASSTVAKHILQIIANTESGKAVQAVLKESASMRDIGKYGQQIIITGINDALASKAFYKEGIWKVSTLDAVTSAHIKKGTASLTEKELYDFNKHLLYSAYSQYLQPITEWGNGASNFFLKKLDEMQIKKAWLGFESFKPAYVNPAFVKNANDAGYLIGTYDSYHSIHPHGKEMWETAAFTDTSLYNEGIIQNKNGTIQKGFQQVGRKLNPVLSLPSVKSRVGDILSNDFAFNSWFIDCDATGEIFDNYLPAHIVTQSQDMEARLQRMAWIRDNKKMVIGSEGGNDFAASTIAFAHGLWSPGFLWSDTDWRTNKTSPYYFGAYFAPDGGVPIHFSKQVPIKPLYDYIYYDCRFNLPLFQLVYNNAVIASHHWGYGSLKLKDEVINNKLREILYNFPPLYNLDRREIVKNQKTISDHIKVFSATHTKAVTLEMTGFDYLSEDKLVQQTSFEKELSIVANFGNKTFRYEATDIPARSLLILYPLTGKKEIYTPVQ